ncbi:toll/interleukin-1 receptor domain-containing protein [Pedobacter aquatilis]|uniref:toll/interleukin-1 receptor domain-containing protein n=1 Tax=Pedobacter aquatilis TaxID=351343 RepID=UPI002930E743|nr:toll/interleukin-1 receptor domain-containing protein [Pedobacter aquatilis]
MPFDQDINNQKQRICRIEKDKDLDWILWNALYPADLDNKFEITFIPRQAVPAIEDFIELIIKEQYQIIILPLTLRDYGSLKIAEFIHLMDLDIKLILISQTDAPQQVLSKLFDVVDETLPRWEVLLGYLTAPNIKRRKDKNAIEELIAAILSLASCVQIGAIGIHKGRPSRLEEYRSGKLEHQDQNRKNIQSRLSVFISYAHQDSLYLNQLETHLSPLKNQGIISVWHDRSISPGEDWAEAIDINLSACDIFILLVSADFLHSSYCYNLEMQVALQRHAIDEVMIIPIIIRPSDWLNAPFAHLQALPTASKAISTWANIDEAWLDVIQGIRQAIQNRMS